jgi:hypothetical protein
VLTIKQLQDEQPIKDILLQHGIEFKKNMDCFFASQKKDDCMGYCLFSYQEDGIKIFLVECFEDEPLFDGLVRAVFHFAAQNGFERAEFGKNINQNLLKKYHFVENGTYCVESMSDFLSKCKNCTR